MHRILSIDQFTKDFPSRYGIESKSDCYIVDEPFFLEILLGYQEYANLDGIKLMSPVWKKMIAYEGDVIAVNLLGTYIIPNENNFYIECRPLSKTKVDEPSFDRFSEYPLSKIGKNVMGSVHPMSFSQRKELMINREL